MNVAVEKLLKPGPDARQVAAGAKPRKPSKKVREAIRLMQTGEARSITDAAKQAKLSRPYLSETLHLPHVQQYILAQTIGEMTAALLRSGPRARELVDAVSEHVSLDAVKHVQGVAGIHAADPRGPLISLTLTSPGYIIDLSGGGDDAARPASFSGSAGVVIDGVANRDDHAARTIVNNRPEPLPRLSESELERQRQKRLWVEDECRAMSADTGRDP
jgi:hypothetical protein